MSDHAFWQERYARVQQEVTAAFRFDLQRMHAEGEAVERWPKIVSLALRGQDIRPNSPLVAIYYEIVAVDALLQFVKRCCK